MRPRVAEVDQHAVAHVLGDKAIEAADRLADRAVVVADQLPQILRVMTGRERGRANQVAEHHRQLPAFGVDCWSEGGIRCCARSRLSHITPHRLSPKAVIALRSLRRWPKELIPSSFRSSAFIPRRISSSMSLSRKSWAYCSSPSPRNHPAMSIQ